MNKKTNVTIEILRKDLGQEAVSLSDEQVLMLWEQIIGFAEAVYNVGIKVYYSQPPPGG